MIVTNTKYPDIISRGSPSVRPLCSISSLARPCLPLDMFLHYLLHFSYLLVIWLTNPCTGMLNAVNMSCEQVGGSALAMVDSPHEDTDFLSNHLSSLPMDIPWRNFVDENRLRSLKNHEPSVPAYYETFSTLLTSLSEQIHGRTPVLTSLPNADCHLLLPARLARCGSKGEVCLHCVYSQSEARPYVPSRRR